MRLDGRCWNQPRRGVARARGAGSPAARRAARPARWSHQPPPSIAALRGTSTGAELTALVSTDELTKRQVVTESGVLLGQVAGIEFDPQTLQLARIEVSAGFFTSNTWIAAEQVTSLGSSAIMVADASAAPDAEPTSPVEAAAGAVASS